MDHLGLKEPIFPRKYPAGWVFRFAQLTLNRPGRLWLEELDNPYAQTARAVSVEKGGMIGQVLIYILI